MKSQDPADWAVKWLILTSYIWIIFWGFYKKESKPFWLAIFNPCPPIPTENLIDTPSCCNGQSWVGFWFLFLACSFIIIYQERLQDAVSGGRKSIISHIHALFKQKLVVVLTMVNLLYGLYNLFQMAPFYLMLLE